MNLKRYVQNINGNSKADETEGDVHDHTYRDHDNMNTFEDNDIDDRSKK